MSRLTASLLHYFTSPLLHSSTPSLLHFFTSPPLQYKITAIRYAVKSPLTSWGGQAPTSAIR
jgi:hypothetical protein